MRTGGWEEKGRKGRNRSGEGHEGYLLRTELSLSSPPSPPGRGERTAPWSGRHTHEGREGGWEGGGKEPWGGRSVWQLPSSRPQAQSGIIKLARAAGRRGGSGHQWSSAR